MRLYHATYKEYLPSIKSAGLGGRKVKRSWNFSKAGVVYLTDNYDTAFSFAETSDTVPEKFLDEIVVLSTDSTNLDSDKLRKDENIRDDIKSFEYKGVIPFSKLRIERSRY